LKPLRSDLNSSGSYGSGASSRLTAEPPDSRSCRCPTSSSIAFCRSALTSVARTSTRPLEFRSSLGRARKVIGKTAQKVHEQNAATFPHQRRGKASGADNASRRQSGRLGADRSFEQGGGIERWHQSRRSRRSLLPAESRGHKASRRPLSTRGWPPC
jgi:hypothetical protein